MSQWQNNQGNWNVSPHAYRRYKAKKAAKKQARRARPLGLRLLWAPFRLTGALIKLAITLAAIGGLVFFILSQAPN